MTWWSKAVVEAYPEAERVVVVRYIRVEDRITEPAEPFGLGAEPSAQAEREGVRGRLAGERRKRGRLDARQCRAEIGQGCQSVTVREQSTALCVVVERAERCRKGRARPAGNDLLLAVVDREGERIANAEHGKGRRLLIVQEH